MGILNRTKHSDSSYINPVIEKLQTRYMVLPGKKNQTAIELKGFMCDISDATHCKWIMSVAHK